MMLCAVFLVQAATAVEKSMRDGRAAARWNEWDAQLVSALNACDGVAKHHDNFPLGESIPLCTPSAVFLQQQLLD